MACLSGVIAVTQKPRSPRRATRMGTDAAAPVTSTRTGTAVLTPQRSSRRLRKQSSTPPNSRDARPRFYSHALDYAGDGVPACADADDSPWFFPPICLPDLPVTAETLFCPYCPLLAWDKLAIRVFPILGETQTFSNIRRQGSRLLIGANPRTLPGLTQTAFLNVIQTPELQHVSSSTRTAVNSTSRGPRVEFFHAETARGL